MPSKARLRQLMPRVRLLQERCCAACAPTRGAASTRTLPGQPSPSAKCPPAALAPSLAEDDELEGAVVVAVLLSPDGRVMPQRRTMTGGG